MDSVALNDYAKFCKDVSDYTKSGILVDGGIPYPPESILTHPFSSEWKPVDIPFSTNQFENVKVSSISGNQAAFIPYYHTTK